MARSFELGRATRRRATVLVALLALAMWREPAAAAPDAPCADVALVLAIDASTSVSDTEYALQTKGLAQALRSADVRAAILRAGDVEMMLVAWSAASGTRTFLPWQGVNSEAEVDRFARRITELARPPRGTTGLGAAVAAGIAALKARQRCALRRVINVSGDGRQSPFAPHQHHAIRPDQARDQAAAEGIEINALAITSEDPALRRYFEENVITGPDAFTLEISSYADIADALRHKLAREVQSMRLSELRR